MWKTKDHVVWRKKNELLVLLDTKSGHYYTLTPVAVDLWLGLFEEKQTLDDVLAGIQSSYEDAPELDELTTDCTETISYWVSEGLIEEAAGR